MGEIYKTVVFTIMLILLGASFLFFSEAKEPQSEISGAAAHTLSQEVEHHSPPPTIIEQGSGIETADYIIFEGDSNLIYAKNGSSGEIHFASSNATYVIQSAIDALNNTGDYGGAGSIFIKKTNQYTNVNPDDLYAIPGRYTVNIDYHIDSTIRVNDGISILSNGAVLNVTTLNDTVFLMNPEEIGYGSGYWTWEISGLGFVGVNENINTTAIDLKNWMGGFVVDNIHTEHVAIPVRIYGSAYRFVVQNSFFYGGSSTLGEKGIYVFQDGASYPPHASTIVNNDISGFKTGVHITGGIGISIANNYFEGDGCALNLTGGKQQVTGNYFQPGADQTGIYTTVSPTITANQWDLGVGSIGIHYDADDGKIVVDSNQIYGNSNSTFFYSLNSSTTDPIATITDNQALFGYNDGGQFIDATLNRGVVANNQINNGDPAINQRGYFTLFEGNAIKSHDIGINTTAGGNQIINNVFTNGLTDIQVYGNNNVIKHNYVSGTTANITSDTLTDQIIKDNIGFVTENIGSAQVGNDYNISHGLDPALGLGYNNASIQVTAYGTVIGAVPIIVGVEGVNSTHFRVGVYWANNTPVPSNPAYIFWKVEWTG